jgi:hypothetical protein
MSAVTYGEDCPSRLVPYLAASCGRVLLPDIAAEACQEHLSDSEIPAP